ncbi:DUF6984 family protein [Mucilaginibacter sp. FT3.2]|uniref:DUF6984 family protein n=1 Tax=Mucilaginibacter sp. FT3.2 TaxID=2723090 RepID=UPI00160EA3D5|nr:hypothetical protein [Mucilaginibacter sp. FT3.2]MBB6230220.1 hypothetical protein [Mucilaginibacter sp. FT3.2]
MALRSLKKEEYDLIAVILKEYPNNGYLIDQLDCAMVEDMKDGGMGSLRFFNKEHRVFGKEIGGIDWIDDDGVPVFSLRIFR